MYIPPTASTGLDESYNTLGHPSGKTPSGGWSSLIGVVTAICGNILISFALNTQRYAHLRLNRHRGEREQEKRRRARRRDTQNVSYGTQQVDVAEQRALRNAKAEPEEYTLDPEHSAESQPLIPKLDSKTRASGESARSDEEGDDEDEKEKSYLKSPIWWLGISMMVVGEAGNFLAYGFAPASIVSPLGVVALISNCIIAPLLLGERFRWRDALGVLIAIGGCVVVVLSASESNPRLTPDGIWYLITRWEFETYLGITIFLIIALSVASNKFGEKTILIDLGLVGLYGGYTALSTKGVASLLSNTIWRAVTFPITYLLVAVLVFTAVMQIKYLNRALQHFNATVVIPTQFVLFTLSVIIGSAVLYRDFEREQTDDAIKFVAGCALTFFGVWCITSGRGKDSEEDDLDEEDEAIDLVDDESTMPEIREREDSTGRRRSSIIAGSSLHQRTDPLVESAAQTSLQDRLSDVPPGLASAVHTDSAAEIQASNTSDPRRPPPLHATTSAPIVPTTPGFASTSLRPKTPFYRTPTSPASPSPSRLSPNRNSQRPPLNSAHRLSNRRSVVGLLPGPLMSPLSGSLSAIVADELRRGVDSSGSVRRKSIRPGQGRRGEQESQSKLLFPTGAKRHSIASGEMDFEAEETAELRRTATSGSSGLGKKGRSLSSTLGDLFIPGSLRKPKTSDARPEEHDD